MDKFLTFTIVGLTVASIYAIFASGLVLTYTTTGIFNFAHGAAGMLFAFVYWQLRFDWGWPAPVALVDGAPRARAVVRGAARARHHARPPEHHGGSQARRLDLTAAVPHRLRPAHLGPGRQPADADVLLLEPARSTSGRRRSRSTRPSPSAWRSSSRSVCACCCTRTRIGIAMRAAVDDRSLSTLNGARPDRISMLAWAIGDVARGTRRHPHRPRPRPRCRLALAAHRRAPTRRRSSAACGACRSRSSARSSSGSPRATSRATSRRTSTCPGCGSRARRSSSSSSCSCSPTRACAAASPEPRVLPDAVSARRPHVRDRHGRLGVVLATTLSTPDQFTYGKIFSIGIVALSLVPLVGFAGQISLCQLSFAGIGAVVMAHLGAGGNPLALPVGGAHRRRGGRDRGAARVAPLRHLPRARHRVVRGGRSTAGSGTCRNSACSAGSR